MLLSATLSKPASQIESILGRKYERAKIRLNSSSSGKEYFAEFFTATQSFHKSFSAEELETFLQENIGKSFKNCVQRTESEEITFLTSKKGKITRIVKPMEVVNTKNSSLPQGFEGVIVNHAIPSLQQGGGIAAGHNRKKNYIIQEGMNVPFLQALGVMNSSGKVIAAKYAKFRQINRFLEMLGDVLPSVLEQKGNKGGGVQQPTGIEADSENGNAFNTETGSLPKGIEAAGSPLKILDFGSGKSYLTFAVHYYLEQIKKIPFSITGIDLKKDVIENCTALARRLNLQNINFIHGDIAKYSEAQSPDIVITLHACDTATDYALAYAIERKAKAILSVPCCQHEINLQLEKSAKNAPPILQPLFKYGIIRERFAALATDATRAAVLEAAGYNVQVLEFIDMEGTPKNLLDLFDNSQLKVIYATNERNAKSEPFPCVPVAA